MLNETCIDWAATAKNCQEILFSRFAFYTYIPTIVIRHKEFFFSTKALCEKEYSQVRFLKNSLVNSNLVISISSLLAVATRLSKLIACEALLLFFI